MLGVCIGGERLSRRKPHALARGYRPNPCSHCDLYRDGYLYGDANVYHYAHNLSYFPCRNTATVWNGDHSTLHSALHTLAYGCLGALPYTYPADANSGSQVRWR